MTAKQESAVAFGTFTLERVYPASPARVFAALSDPRAKSRWFPAWPPGWQAGGYTLDFRVGGAEQFWGRSPDGLVLRYDAAIHNVVPDARITMTYVMHEGDKCVSVSINTIELRPQGNGTHLTLTEQGAFFDGFDAPAQREEGGRAFLEILGAHLADGRPA
jgi:uncharacterized protein YndB with AHSA1/START domain